MPGRNRSNLLRWMVGSVESAVHSTGEYSTEAPPCKVFDPDFVIAFTTKPPVRPNSAETPPRVMLTSWMSTPVKF